MVQHYGLLAGPAVALRRRTAQQHHRPRNQSFRHGFHEDVSAEGIACARIARAGHQHLQYSELHIDRYVGYFTNLRPGDRRRGHAANYDHSPLSILRNRVTSMPKRRTTRILVLWLVLCLLCSSLPLSPQQAGEYTFLPRAVLEAAG